MWGGEERAATHFCRTSMELQSFCGIPRSFATSLAPFATAHVVCTPGEGCQERKTCMMGDAVTRPLGSAGSGCCILSPEVLLLQNCQGLMLLLLHGIHRKPTPVRGSNIQEVTLKKHAALKRTQVAAWYILCTKRSVNSSCAITDGLLMGH